MHGRLMSLSRSVANFAVTLAAFGCVLSQLGKSLGLQEVVPFAITLAVFKFQGCLGIGLLPAWDLTLLPLCVLSFCEGFVIVLRSWSSFSFLGVLGLSLQQAWLA